MSLDWTEEERLALEKGVAAHGIRSGRCAALARIVYVIAKPRDEHAHGVQIKPAGCGRWLVPNRPEAIPYWESHTYVETRSHAVDAITGPEGYAAEMFLEKHWAFSTLIDKSEVDPATVDPDIQYMDEP
jgi:hypothetical protein